MAGFNPNKLVQQLRDSAIKVLEASERAVVIGMNELKADMNERVFDRGQDVNGEQIGSYSTSPTYISLNQPSQFRASSLKGKGKNSNDPKFKNGKSRKSQYMAGGYKEFRQVVGRQNQFVDLRLTGALRGSLTIGTRQSGIELSIRGSAEVTKAEGNEERFGKTIFEATPDEINRITQIWEEEISNAFYSSFE